MMGACTWMSEERASDVLGRQVLKRPEVLARLQAAVWLNAANCPNNQSAALYAIDYSIGSELNQPFYDKESVDICVVGLLVVPCAASAPTESTTIAAYYSAVVRACGPLPRGL